MMHSLYLVLEQEWWKGCDLLLDAGADVTASDFEHEDVLPIILARVEFHIFSYAIRFFLIFIIVIVYTNNVFIQSSTIYLGYKKFIFSCFDAS